MYQLEPFAPVEFKLRAKAERRERRLSLTYVFDETLRDGPTPGSAGWARGDELWRTTCFEAFFAEPDRPAYYELNFSPSRRQWNAYAFAAYRQPQPPLAADDFELADIQMTAGMLHAEVILPPRISTLDLSLCAVVHLPEGLRYFATNHAADRPDFHRRDAFTLRV